ncbi:MAG: hypothetical protein GY929_20745, partial [Actinomycetia bacterium]|nr:hypothetical protein [Actinomycetes bacterium]
DLEHTVMCGGGAHILRWHGGELLLDQHPDIDAERALVAFGGEAPACVARYELWREAVADGGFLGEWAHRHEIGRDRIWWLKVAIERMRAEGVQEFLRDMPRSSAARMGQFITSFPQSFVDQAAAEVARRRLSGGGVGYPGADRLIEEGVALRVREAFARSVGGTHLSLGAAALVPFRPQVTDATEPSITGVLHGRNSRVEVVVPAAWLSRVWGRGAAVVDGHLILDVDDETGLATVVAWQREAPGRFQPALEKRVLSHGSAGWSLA